MAPNLLSGDRLFCYRVSSKAQPSPGEVLVAKTSSNALQVLKFQSGPGEVFNYQLFGEELQLEVPKLGDTLLLSYLAPHQFQAILSVLQHELKKKDWGYEFQFYLENVFISLDSLAEEFGYSRNQLDSLFGSPYGGIHCFYFQKQFGQRYPAKNLSVQLAVSLNGTPISNYIVRENYVAMMGNIHSGSFDTRYGGFIPTSSLYAKPLFILWSKDPKGNMRWNRTFKILK